MPRGKRSAAVAGVASEPSNKRRKLNTSNKQSVSKSRSKSPLKKTAIKSKKVSKQVSKRKSPRVKVDKAKLKALRKDGIKRFLAQAKQLKKYNAKIDITPKEKKPVSFFVTF